jgi:hypothetical protein
MASGGKMFTDCKPVEMSRIVCDNCGEELDGWDPLEPNMWCSMCKMRAEQISENARRELAVFGEMRRKVRENAMRKVPEENK